MEEKFKGDLMRLILLVLTFFAHISFGSQHDYVIDNQTGALFRADINSALVAGQTKNSGSSAPATTYAFQFWMDTSGGTPILKMRNAANSAWINIGDGSLTGLGLLDRTGGTVTGAVTFNNTDHIKLPVGTTAQRPGSPADGQIRYNSTTAKLEVYYSGGWNSIASTAEANPAGTVIAFANGTCPAGYLAADGAQVSRATYSVLFTAISTAHGTGDGSTTFHLPDYRGRFLRGVDGSAGRDPNDTSRTAMNSGGSTGDAVGSVQDDAFESHTHTQDAHFHELYGRSMASGDHFHVNSSPYYASVTGNSEATGSAFATTGGTSVLSSTATNQNTGGSETRPMNAYVQYCIKI